LKGANEKSSASENSQSALLFLCMVSIDFVNFVNIMKVSFGPNKQQSCVAQCQLWGCLRLELQSFGVFNIKLCLYANKPYGFVGSVGFVRSSSCDKSTFSPKLHPPRSLKPCP